MDSEFKKYLQDFLKRYGVDTEQLDFNIVDSLHPLWDQLKDYTSKEIDLHRALKLIFDLHEQGVYLYLSSYQSTKAYARRKYEWVKDCRNGMFSTENYIERFLLDNAVKEAIYKDESKYAMGNPYRLIPSECTVQSVAEEIAKRKGNKENEMYHDVESIRKNLYRDSGIIGRLKRDLNFDIKKFDKSLYKAEVCKILYYIYEIENDKVPDFRGSKRFELPKFLMKSSGNLGKRSVSGQGNYGERVQRNKIMQLIELTIEKELDVQRLNDIRDTIDNITKKWEALNVYVISLMEKCALFGEPLLEIEKVKERTDQITNKLGEIDESVNILDFSISPIAVLYFLIRQQRSLCEIEENIKACDLMQKVKYRIWESPHRDTTMKELYYCGMPLNEVEDFIDMETELLAVCIYGGSKLSDEEWTKRMRNIRYRKKQVHKLLSF